MSRGVRLLVSVGTLRRLGGRVRLLNEGGFDLRSLRDVTPWLAWRLLIRAAISSRLIDGGLSREERLRPAESASRVELVTGPLPLVPSGDRVDRADPPGSVVPREPMLPPPGLLLRLGGDTLLKLGGDALRLGETDGPRDGVVPRELMLPPPGLLLELGGDALKLGEADRAPELTLPREVPTPPREMPLPPLMPRSDGPLPPREAASPRESPRAERWAETGVCARAQTNVRAIARSVTRFIFVACFIGAPLERLACFISVIGRHRAIAYLFM